MIRVIVLEGGPSCEAPHLHRLHARRPPEFEEQGFGVAGRPLVHQADGYVDAAAEPQHLELYPRRLRRAVVLGHTSGEIGLDQEGRATVGPGIALPEGFRGGADNVIDRLAVAGFAEVVREVPGRRRELCHSAASRYTLQWAFH